MATELEQKIERLMQTASKVVGFEITAENFRQITPEQSRALLKQLGSNPDFRELALTRGSPVAEASIWLSARQSGTDLPLEHVARMSQGLTARPSADELELDVSVTAEERASSSTERTVV